MHLLFIFAYNPKIELDILIKQIFQIFLHIIKELNCIIHSIFQENLSILYNTFCKNKIFLLILNNNTHTLKLRFKFKIFNNF